MPIPSFQTRCLKKTHIATDTYELRLHKPDGFDFKPGQFVMFDVPSLDDPADIQPRAYSIASTPDEEDLLFIIAYKPGGRASEWLKHSLDVGDEVRMQGPLGAFGIKEDAQSLFVCTGTGNAPFRSMISDALKRGFHSRIDMIFGVRSEDRLFWIEEFERLTHEYGNFFFHPTVSQPSDRWTGHKGRVQALFPRVCPSLHRKIVYACGNPEMTTEVKALCLEEHGMDKKKVHIEGYI